jgi:hemerythrin
MHVDWTPDLAVGIPEIDAQHQEIFRRADALLLACRQGRGRKVVGETLAFLSRYVDTHFAAEEDIQRRSGYPGLDAHRLQHAAFVATVTGLQSRLADQGTALPVTVELNRVLVDWLVTHIKTEDTKVGRHLRGGA